MEDFIKLILEKQDKIMEAVNALQIAFGQSEERIEARLQNGNDRFVVIEKKLEGVEAAHTSCEIRTNPGYRMFLKFGERHLGDMESMVAHWIDRKNLIDAGKKNITSEAIKIIFTVISTLAAAAIAWVIARGKM